MFISLATYHFHAVRVGFKTKFDNFLFSALRKQIAVGDLVNVKQFANKQELELRHDLKGGLTTNYGCSLLF